MTCVLEVIAMTLSAAALDILGVEHPEISPEREIVQAIRRGFSIRLASQVATRFNIPESKLAQLIGITPRTLARHKKGEKILTQAPSDRLYRLARVIALAKEVFESEATAKDWLNRPNRALGGTKPLELLDTDAGVEQVVDLLNRIDYGVYS
jgi:putative toxin-antitoxin system antitoxin component (TIGR02293 family)